MCDRAGPRLTANNLEPIPVATTQPRQYNRRLGKVSPGLSNVTLNSESAGFRPHRTGQVHDGHTAG